MNRRDFLSLRTGPRGRTLELSCERLYMRCLDSRVGDAENRAPDYDVSVGEPPAVRSARTPSELFDQIDRDLVNVDTLMVRDPAWLADNDLKERFEAVLISFRARGGRVEFSVSSPS
jgi:hypothetical protein